MVYFLHNIILCIRVKGVAISLQNKVIDLTCGFIWWQFQLIAVSHLFGPLRQNDYQEDWLQLEAI